MTRLSTFVLMFSMILSIENRVTSPSFFRFPDRDGKEGKKNQSRNELRHHLYEILKEAYFHDILHHDNTYTDEFGVGIAESDQKIFLSGYRVTGLETSDFCGSLAAQKFFHVPVAHRDALIYKPTKLIPIPVTKYSMTVSLPSQWFRESGSRSPVIYVCYEGDSFLKISTFKTDPIDWEVNGKFRKMSVENSLNDRCRVREIMVVLDDFWNNRNLFPRRLESRVLLETKSILPRVTFSNECDATLGLEQPCCLWKFRFQSDGVSHEFNRCFGSLPVEALQSTQIPTGLADLLSRGGMTRRFLSLPTRVCREIEFRPMTVRKPDGDYITARKAHYGPEGLFPLKCTVENVSLILLNQTDKVTCIQKTFPSECDFRFFRSDIYINNRCSGADAILIDMERSVPSEEYKMRSFHRLRDSKYELPKVLVDPVTSPNLWIPRLETDPAVQGMAVRSSDRFAVIDNFDDVDPRLAEHNTLFTMIWDTHEHRITHSIISYRRINDADINYNSSIRTAVDGALEHNIQPLAARTLRFKDMDSALQELTILRQIGFTGAVIRNPNLIEMTNRVFGQ